MSLPTRNLSAIVTGSSRGIGRAIALRLANDGFSVALDGLPSMQKGLETLSRKIKSTGWESMIDPCDVTDEKAVGGMVDRTVKGWLICMWCVQCIYVPLTFLLSHIAK